MKKCNFFYSAHWPRNNQHYFIMSREKCIISIGILRYAYFRVVSVVFLKQDKMRMKGEDLKIYFELKGNIAFQEA